MINELEVEVVPMSATERNSFDKEDLVKCGNGELFESEIRLPKDNMLMMDRILHIDNTSGEFG